MPGFLLRSLHELAAVHRDPTTTRRRGRRVEGGGEVLQLDALTAKICQILVI